MNYTKEETKQYTHLLMEAKTKFNTQLWSSLQEDYDTLEFIDCFNSIGIQYNSMVPVKIKTKPCLAILKRKIQTVAEQGKSEKKKKRSKDNADNAIDKEEESDKPIEVDEKPAKKKKRSKDNTDAKLEESEKIIEEQEKSAKKKKRSKDNKDNVDIPQEETIKSKEVKEEKPKKSKKKKTSKELLEEETKMENIEKDIEAEVTEIKENLEEENSAQEILDEQLNSHEEKENTINEDLKPHNETPPNLANLLSQGVSLEDDAIVSTVESYEDFPTTLSEETNDSSQVNKEINFQELRNLALGQVNRKTRATKLKIRRIIEQHYRAKGKHIENDSKEKKYTSTTHTTSHRQSVKAIIKQERIKEMIEQISTMDLTKMCNLEKVSTKDCLKLVIDKMDEEGGNQATT